MAQLWITLPKLVLRFKSSKVHGGTLHNNKNKNKKLRKGSLINRTEFTQEVQVGHLPASVPDD